MGTIRSEQLIIFVFSLQLVTNSASSKANICFRSTRTHSGIPPGKESLNFSNTNISELKSSNAKHYGTVKHLDLSDNAIRSTNHIRALHTFKQLKQLDLSGNDIYNFDPSTFCRNQNLTFLNVANNTHIFIKEKRAFLPSLKWLSLNGCNLENFPIEMLRGFPNLQYLDLRNNQLLSLPSNIKDILPNIECILLSNNPLELHATDLEFLVTLNSDLNITVEKRDSFGSYNSLSNLTNNGISNKLDDDESDDDVDIIYVSLMLALAILALAVALTMVVIHCRNL